MYTSVGVGGLSARGLLLLLEGSDQACQLVHGPSAATGAPRAASRASGCGGRRYRVLGKQPDLKSYTCVINQIV